MSAWGPIASSYAIASRAWCWYAPAKPSREAPFVTGQKEIRNAWFDRSAWLIRRSRFEEMQMTRNAAWRLRTKRRATWRNLTSLSPTIAAVLYAENAA